MLRICDQFLYFEKDSAGGNGAANEAAPVAPFGVGSSGGGGARGGSGSGGGGSGR